MQRFKYTFKNGVVVETDNLSHLRKIAEGFGEIVDLKDWHFSESAQALVRISGMHSDHIRNAIVKEFVSVLMSSRELTDKELVDLLANISPRFLPATDKLFSELVRRTK